jgi:hypothetical protein
VNDFYDPGSHLGLTFRLLFSTEESLEGSDAYLPSDLHLTATCALDRWAQG